MTENEFLGIAEKCSCPIWFYWTWAWGGSTTIGVEICSSLRKNYPDMKVLIFTGEVLNEKLWVDALNAGADGIILKTGELLTATDVQAVMDGKRLVFNYPILEKNSGTFSSSRWLRSSVGRKLSSIMILMNMMSVCFAIWPWGIPKK